jgi:hypothetical protein
MVTKPNLKCTGERRPYRFPHVWDRLRGKTTLELAIRLTLELAEDPVCRAAQRPNYEAVVFCNDD